MLTFSQKGFQFQLPVTDNEIWGVGMVACQWASLEDLLDHLIAHVNGGPALNSNGGPLSLSGRIRLLRQIIGGEVTQPLKQAAFIQVVDQIHSLQDERDRVIHHVWSDTDGKKTLFDWRAKNRKPSERPMNGQKLLDLARRIEQAKLSLFDFLIREGEVQADQPIFETAWRRLTAKS